MTDITGAKVNISTEETKAGAAVSQATLQRMGGAINYINYNSTTQLGDIISSALTEAQFQSLRGNNWVRFSGQDITGSDFHALTGVATLPNQYAKGSLIQTDNESSLLGLDAGENKSHNHSPEVKRVYGEVPGTGSDHYTGFNETVTLDSSESWTNDYIRESTLGDSTNHASGIKTNFFIKINSEPT